MKTIFVFFLFGLIQIVSAQSVSELPPESYFDFWLGKWELSYEDPGGSMARGTNTVERVLSDKVIKENFEGLTGQNKGYIGKSWSVYNTATKTWHQTWVDNQGSYLDFVGEIDGEKRIFKRESLNEKGEKVLQRMVFHGIEKDAFTWDWESSSDGGENWQLRWRIQYKRAGDN